MINWNTLKLGSILFGATRQQITIQRQITYANLLLKNKKENIIVFNFNKLKDVRKSEEDIARIANFEKKLEHEKKAPKSKERIWEFRNHVEREIKDKFREEDRICEKEGEKFYRVLGFWKCLKCRKEWKNYETWINLKKWKNRTPFSEIKEDDLIQQKCPNCNNEINKISLCTNKQKKSGDENKILELNSKDKLMINKMSTKPKEWFEMAIKNLENKIERKGTSTVKSLKKLETFKKQLKKINDQNLDVKS